MAYEEIDLSAENVDPLETFAVAKMSVLDDDGVRNIQAIKMNERWYLLNNPTFGIFMDTISRHAQVLAGLVPPNDIEVP